MNSYNKSGLIDWLARLIKGGIVGIGGILPGLSGGALAVAIGIYEPMMAALSNLRVDFKKKFIYFLPIIIGALIGVIALAKIVELLFQEYSAPIIYLFLGFIAGTLPSLFAVAGSRGRKMWHYILLFISAVGMWSFLELLAGNNQNLIINPNFFWWVFSGILMGTGAVVPGMSPSNFLIYLGLYEPLASGIASMELSIIIPWAIGVVLSILLLAKVVYYLLSRAYTAIYHIIIGVVIGSSIAIIPDWPGIGMFGLSIVLLLLGSLFSYWLVGLDTR